MRKHFALSVIVLLPSHISCNTTIVKKLGWRVKGSQPVACCLWVLGSFVGSLWGPVEAKDKQGRCVVQPAAWPALLPASHTRVRLGSRHSAVFQNVIFLMASRFRMWVWIEVDFWESWSKLQSSVSCCGAVDTWTGLHFVLKTPGTGSFNSGGLELFNKTVLVKWKVVGFWFVFFPNHRCPLRSSGTFELFDFYTVSRRSSCNSLESHVVWGGFVCSIIFLRCCDVFSLS